MRPLLALAGYLFTLAALGLLPGAAASLALIVAAQRRARRIVAEAEERARMRETWARTCAEGIEARALALAEAALDVERLSASAPRWRAPLLPPPPRR